MDHSHLRNPISNEHDGVLLGEQAASKTAGQGSNPCTVAWQAREDHRFAMLPFDLAKNEVFGVCRNARDRAKVVDQVRFLARTLVLTTNQ